MTDDIKDPYKEGRRAAVKGLDRSANPYWKANDREDWSNGFDDQIAMLVTEGETE